MTFISRETDQAAAVSFSDWFGVAAARIPAAGDRLASFLLWLHLQRRQQFLEILSVAEEVEVGVLLHVGGVLEAGGDGLGQPGHRLVGVLLGEPGGVRVLRLRLQPRGYRPEARRVVQADRIRGLPLLE